LVKLHTVEKLELRLLLYGKLCPSLNCFIINTPSTMASLQFDDNCHIRHCHNHPMAQNVHNPVSGDKRGRSDGLIQLQRATSHRSTSQADQLWLR
jgi:hypothetical protein